jgi:uncharacterized membrane protein YsdA (DUF1294 family)/cold shock CspA family protein
MSVERRGVVVSFDPDRGFGFIRASGMPDDVFVHVSEIVGDPESAGDRLLRPGQRVRFVVEGSERGPRAVRVVPGKAGLPPSAASALFVLGVLIPSSGGLHWAGLPWPISWFLVITVGTFAIWAWDKHRATRGLRRIPETALLGLAGIGGTLGALLGIGLLGHKRRKPRLLIALGGIATAQLILLAFWLSRP